MQAAFGRLSSRVLAHLGKDSILRVGTPCTVNIKHGVQFAGYGNETAAQRGTGGYDLTVARSVVTMPNDLLAKVGDRLQHPDGDYDLDMMLADNGYTTQFVLRDHVA